MKNAYFYDARIGKLFIAQDEQGITDVSLGSEQVGDNRNDQFDLEYELIETELLKDAARQLGEYLEGTRKEFQIKLNPKGTEFQRKVWEALRTIPYGETRSYKQIAEAVGNANACWNGKSQ